MHIHLHNTQLKQRRLMDWGEDEVFSQKKMNLEKLWNTCAFHYWRSDRRAARDRRHLHVSDCECMVVTHVTSRLCIVINVLSSTQEHFWWWTWNNGLGSNYNPHALTCSLAKDPSRVQIIQTSTKSWMSTVKTARFFTWRISIDLLIIGSVLQHQQSF